MRDRLLFVGVAVACVLPPLAVWLGLELGSTPQLINAETYGKVSDSQRAAAPFVVLRGDWIHCLLEWSGVCVAAMTALLSLIHYFLKRDVTTPVIATALMFAGVLDAMRVITIVRLVGPVADPVVFTAMTWSLSRVFLAAILIAGTLPFLFRDFEGKRPVRDGFDFALLAVVYLLAAATLSYYARENLVLPGETDEVVRDLTTPLAWAGLVLFLIAGGVLFFYRRRKPSLFATALQASLIPHVCAQAALLLSDRLYDDGFQLASVYKLIGYLVPSVGLILDYRRASFADAELKTTERQLDIARDIQNSLLPEEPPGWQELDARGFSVSSEAVGGDYFDFITLPDGGRLTVITDVSGHDLGAALLMANGRAYLRAIAETTSDLSQLAERFNAFVARDAGGRRFITGMFVKVAPGGAAEALTAGHCGYLVRPDETFTTLEQENLPFGVMDDFCSDSVPVEFAAGDTILLLTDGIQELPNRRGEQFGTARLAAAVAAPAGTSCRDSLDRVRRAATDWAEGVPPFDDMTLVLIRRRA